MYVYRGVLNYDSYAKNEWITVIAPTAFDIGEPILAYWQWTKDANGVEKSPADHHGSIDVLEAKGSARKIGITFGYYRYDGELSANKKTMSVTMTSTKGGVSNPISLKLIHHS